MAHNLLFPSGPITQQYGPTEFTGEPPGHGHAHWHSGIDYGAATGTPILAAENGTIILAGQNNGYGISVTESIGDGITVLWGHMQRVTVHMGQAVKRGEVIGYSNNTGNSTGPHIHFETRLNGVDVNPNTITSSVAQTLGNDPFFGNEIGTAISNIPNPLDVFKPLTDFLSNRDTLLRLVLVLGGVALLIVGANVVVLPKVADVVKAAPPV